MSRCPACGGDIGSTYAYAKVCASCYELEVIRELRWSAQTEKVTHGWMICHRSEPMGPDIPRSTNGLMTYDHVLSVRRGIIRGLLKETGRAMSDKDMSQYTGISWGPFLHTRRKMAQDGELVVAGKEERARLWALASTA